MSDTIELAGGSVDVSTYLGRDVILEVEDGVVFMSPAEAVNLSRALVKAAGEVLGVEV